MSSKGEMDFSDISRILKEVESYGEENIVTHISKLQNRISVINQTVREGDSTATLRLDKVQIQFQGLKDKYVSLESNFSSEDKINVMKKVEDINKQIEKFEGK